MGRTLVFGATGNVGGLVVDQLLAAGETVRAVVRNPETASLASGVEVVRGDLSVPESLDQCLRDIDAVFLVWIAPPTTVEAVVERIASRVPRIVFLAGPHKTPHPLFQQPNRIADLHRNIEQAIENSGMQWTFVRPGMFASNAREWWGPQIRAGGPVRWPYLQVPTAPIDPRDIAAVSVRALRENGHAAAEYVITGPESLTHLDQILAIGSAIGRTLRIEELAPEDVPRELASILPPPASRMLMNAWAAAAGQPAFVSDTFRQVTGIAPRTFAQWAADHAAEFRS